MKSFVIEISESVSTYLIAAELFRWLLLAIQTLTIAERRVESRNPYHWRQMTTVSKYRTLGTAFAKGCIWSICGYYKIYPIPSILYD